MDVFKMERQAMVEKLIARRGLDDPRLLAAFDAVPRHLFVPPAFHRQAYQDRALPIGFGQTISQAYVVAYMTDLLCLHGAERVLEVGTGSGYQAAILSHMAGEVYTIELDPRLARHAQELLSSLGCQNVSYRVGDGALGWPEVAPFNGIVVTAFAARVPEPLLEQLCDGGRVVMPVGSRWAQMLECWTRKGNDFECRSVLPVAFVPLRGELGWKD
jgi:protein-L-isoaspartate(D-aspartate) O-methyltransferase